MVEEYTNLAGSFQVISQEMVLSDPSYLVGSLGQLVLSPVVKGTWKVTQFSHPYYLNVWLHHEDEVSFVPTEEHLAVSTETGLLGVYDTVSFRHPKLLPTGVDTWAALHEGIITYRWTPFGFVYVVPKGLRTFNTRVQRTGAGLISAMNVRIDL